MADDSWRPTDNTTRHVYSDVYILSASDMANMWRPASPFHTDMATIQRQPHYNIRKSLRPSNQCVLSSNGPDPWRVGANTARTYNGPRVGSRSRTNTKKGLLIDPCMHSLPSPSRPVIAHTLVRVIRQDVLQNIGWPPCRSDLSWVFYWKTCL